MNETIGAYVEANQMDTFLNANLLAHLQLFRFPKYHYVYIEQDEQHYLYFLVEGQVQCFHHHQNGKLAVVSLSDPFTVIGEFEILNEEHVRTNVIATKDTAMLGIAREIVHQYGANDPLFLHYLIDELRRKLFRANRLQTSHVLPLADRLALYILSMGVTPDSTIVLPEKEAMASLLGVTPRHLNRVLRELSAEGLISGSYPEVLVRDREGLEALLGD